MAIHILRNTRLFTGGVDLTALSNKVELSSEVEEKDATTFANVDANGDVWKAVLPGIRSANLNASGFWESLAAGAGGVDETLWTQTNAGPNAWTVCPVSANLGDVAYFTLADESSYKVFGGTGDVAPWEASMQTAWPLARGMVVNPPGTPRTATGVGTSVDFGVGGWPAGKTMYAGLHVLSASGTTPSITARIETATDTIFTTPTTRITFAAATGRGSQVLRNTGNFTDRYARAAWTISGTTPSFLALIVVGTVNG